MEQILELVDSFREELISEYYNEDRLIDILSILKVKLINKGLHSVLIIDRDTYTLGGLYNKIREEVKHIPNAIKLLGDRK